MGLALLTPTLTGIFSLSAPSKAHTTFITTLLLSLAALRGAFDVPTEKCPPDRLKGGSSDSVTGCPASTAFISSPSTPARSYPDSRPLVYPLTPPSSTSSLCNPVPVARGHSARPVPIPNHPLKTQLSNSTNNNGGRQTFHGLATPPLTPESVSDVSPISATSAQQRNDALEFLSALFPRSALSALPHSRSVRISSAEMGINGDLDSDEGLVFEAVVLSLPNKPKTLYVNGKGAEHIELRESIVALLDLASEHFQCEALVIALERASPALSGLLHSLMYVGATVVTRPPFPTDDGFVLVGMEI